VKIPGTDRYSYIPVDMGSHTAGCVNVQRVRVSSQDVSACVDQSFDCSSLTISRWVVAVVKKSKNFKESKRPVTKMSAKTGGKMSFSHRNDTNFVGLCDRFHTSGKPT